MSTIVVVRYDTHDNLAALRSLCLTTNNNPLPIDTLKRKAIVGAVLGLTYLTLLGWCFSTASRKLAKVGFFRHALASIAIKFR